jgi:phage FluMu protein Com
MTPAPASTVTPTWVRVECAHCERQIARAPAPKTVTAVPPAAGTAVVELKCSSCKRLNYLAP